MARSRTDPFLVGLTELALACHSFVIAAIVVVVRA